MSRHDQQVRAGGPGRKRRRARFASRPRRLLTGEMLVDIGTRLTYFARRALGLPTVRIDADTVQHGAGRSRITSAPTSQPGPRFRERKPLLLRPRQKRPDL